MRGSSSEASRRTATPRSLFWSLLVAVTSCSPAATTPAPTPTPTASIAAAPATPGPLARWVFDSEHPDVFNELDLGDGTVLQVSVRGRRWRMPRDKARAVEHSELVLPEDVRDVRREGAKFLFVGNRGGVFVSDGPLTIANRVSKSLDFSAEFAAGKRALLGVEADGTLHRTQDLGATWSKTKLPLRAGEVVSGLAANTRGEALVLLRPQRVLHSTDDGATWTSLGTPGIGAGDVTRDAKGDLWLLGAMVEKQAKLVGNPPRFEVATGYTGRLSRHKAEANRINLDDDESAGNERETSSLVGDRVVRVKTSSKPNAAGRAITIGVSALRGKQGPPQEVTDAATSDQVRVGGWENVVVVGWEDDRKSEALALSRTIDDGKTRESLGRVEIPGAYGSHIFALPGWTAVAGNCRKTACDSARFKVDGGEWQTLGIAPDTAVKYALYDKARERVLVLGSTGSRDWTLYAGKRDAALQRVDLKLPRGYASGAAIDDAGTLRIVMQDTSRSLHIQKITSDLKLASPIYPPFDAKHIELTGARGLAYTDDRAWETADGGEHWTPTGVGGGPADCGASGCMVSGMLRVGWDLPDPAKPLVASTATAATTDRPSGKSRRKTPATSTSIAVPCKVTSGWKSYAGEPMGATLGLDGGVRFASRIYDMNNENAHVFRLLGAAPATQLVTLSPTAKAPTGATSVQHDHMSNDGLIAVRASYVRGSSGPGKKYSPVDVDLAWHSLATGKTQRVTLSKVSAFRVGSSDLGALTAIVDGGLLFLASTGDSPLYFIRDNGKIETLPRPATAAGGRFEDAVRVGEQIILGQRGANDIALVSTTDAGKTWTTTVWSFTDSAGLVTIDKQPAIALYDSQAVVAVVPFASITNDPPPMVTTKRPSELLTSNKLVACAAGPARGVRSETEGEDDASLLVATIAGAGKTPITAKVTQGFTRIHADGGACTDLVVGDGDDDSGRLLLSPADPTHAWLVRSTSGDTPKFEAATVSCTLP